MQIEGRNPVIELLRSKRQVKKVLIQAGINEDEKITELLNRARQRHIYIEEAPRKKLDYISSTKNHQGVIAFAEIEMVKLADAIEEGITHKKPNWFICVREALLEDNIGAIARSAEAAGFAGIVIPPKIDLSPQMFRSSMGSLANIKIIREGVFQAIKTSRKYGMRVIGVELFTDNELYVTDLSGDVMIIVGGEDRSLSEEIREKCDTVVKIPMRGKINSLNMSVAASVVMFEKLRQEII